MAPLPLLVTVADFAEAIGEDYIDDEDGRALAALRGASSRVRSYTGRTWVDPTSGTPLAVPDAVVAVVIAAAQRKWDNPAGTIQDTTGPFTVRRPERAGDGVYLTDDDKADLKPYAIGRRALWTQRLAKDDAYLDDVVRDTVFVEVVGGEPMPWGTTAEIGPTS